MFSQQQVEGQLGPMEFPLLHLQKSLATPGKYRHGLNITCSMKPVEVSPPWVDADSISEPVTHLPPIYSTWEPKKSVMPGFKSGSLHKGLAHTSEVTPREKT